MKQMQPNTIRHLINTHVWERGATFCTTLLGEVKCLETEKAPPLIAVLVKAEAVATTKAAIVNFILLI